jgi:thiamine biosynthesis protein ThiI
VDLSLVESAVRERKVLDLRALEAVDLVQPYLFVAEIPDDAVVIDCRELHHFRAWHYRGAVQRGLEDLAAHFRELDRERKYVLYCSFGVLTAHLAEIMQREGYEAYSFKGGVRQLMGYAETRGIEPLR